MIKTIGETSSDFIRQLKERQIEREVQEKAEWEALSETEKQEIIADRERIAKQKEIEEQTEKREWQLAKWERHGVTKRYFEAEWDNWIANTPEKIKAITAAKMAWSANLLFTGKNGTGKTHLAMCLAKDGAIYRRLPDIFREVRSSYDISKYVPSANLSLHNGVSESEILDNYGECKLLIIDEIGRQKFSDFEMNLLFEIIDRRWNNVLPTTLITNLTVQEFEELYSAAILDRLRPLEVLFNWESMRGGEQNA